jgi:glycosyltransferase involved in cell wall biosynthesis/polysaccharide pyruvyl transferase WcaK-like protein
VSALDPASRSKLLRVVLFNVKFSPNLGDGLLSECLEAELATCLPGLTIENLDLAGRTRYSSGRNSRERTLVLLHSSPQLVRHFVSETILGRKLRREMRGRWRNALRDSDAAIVGGGNLLSDSDLNFPLKIEAAMAETQAAGVPTAVYGVGVSDNWSPRGEALFASALSAQPLYHAAVRDVRSADIWRRRLGPVGVSAPEIVRDPAMLTAIHFPARSRERRDAPLIAIGVTHPIALRYHATDQDSAPYRLDDWLVALAGACLAKGWNAALFTNGSPEDEAYLAELRPRLEALKPQGALSIVPRAADPRALAEFVSTVDLLMAHRLHANIAAYSYGIPQIGFSWDVKLKSVLEEIGRGNCLVSAGGDSVDAVVDLAVRQLETGVDRSRLGTVVAETRADIARLGDAILRAARRPHGSDEAACVMPTAPAGTRRAAERLVIVNDFSIARGGATALALLETELFRRSGVPLTFIAGDAGGNPDLERWGVEVLAMGQQRLLEAGPLSAGFRGVYNRSALATLAAWIGENDTPETVYHLHIWSQVLSPSVFTALASVRGRTVITAHDFFLVCPNGAYANYAAGTKCSLTPLSARCVMSACDKRNYFHKLWRVTRQGVQSRLLRFEGARPMVLMIHEGMREPLERGGTPDAALRALANPIRPWLSTRVVAESNRTFLFVGRLEEEKGPDLAARAARRARVPLTIVGDGPLRASLQTEFPEFTFTGQLPPGAIAEHARTSRALIMPSRYPEPYGLVAVEALWSGIPLVIAESALLAPEIARRRAGLAVNPLEEQSFAEVLGAMARDDALVSQMSRAAFDNTRDLGLTPEAWMEQLEVAFSDLLAPSPRSQSAA